MKTEKNNISYTAEDIRKYLDGELSDPQMQAMEKAALEDPFLADAIEGFEESRHHPFSFEAGLADLEKRLATRTEGYERKTGITILFSKWKIAASVLFILGVTIFTYTFINSKNRAELANTTRKDSNAVPAAEPEKVTADTTSITSVTKSRLNAGSDTTGNAAIVGIDESTSARAQKTAKEFRKKDIITSEKKKEKPSPVSLSAESADTDSESAGYAKSSKNNEQPVPESKSIAAQQNEMASGLKITRDKAIPENFIKGVVVDNKGKPIPFASVKFKGSGNGTLTDTGGQFKLYMKNPSITAELEFVHPGYEPATAELIPDSGFSNTVRLNEIESSLSEVVVTEESDEDKGQSSDLFLKNSKYKNASTVLGREEFDNYINKNKKIVSADSLLKGEEIISFMLQADGKMSSFKIEKSISPAHDAEILDLIKSAPPLKLQNAKKQRCRVTISFP